MVRLETRTITLRLVVASHGFGARRLALDKAMGAALAGAEAELIGWGFRAVKTAGEIIDEGPINVEGDD